MIATRTVFGVVSLLVAVGVTGCGNSLASTAESDAPKNLLVGRWSGKYVNPPAANGQAAPSMAFEFEFRSDGTYRMGKRKVGVEGTYRFLEPKTFETKIKNTVVGPYQIIEATPSRFVYERQLEEGRIQRTELTRLS
jgi:hypothetical protein